MKTVIEKIKEEIKNAIDEEEKADYHKDIARIGMNGGLQLLTIDTLGESKQLKKYWNKIPFPAGITLVEAVEIIEKYIKMEGENGI